MSTNKNDQEHVPMAVTKNRHQPETITTAIVETSNKINKKGQRDNWSNRVVYLLSIIGFVVDLGKDFFK
jgi:hypothetical protein